MKCLISGIKEYAIGDYPGLTSTTVFFNKDKKSEEIEFEDLTNKISESGVKAVLLSGVEPLAQYEACEAITKWAKKNKLKVGIHTLGLFEKELRKLIENKLVDFVRLELSHPIKSKSVKSSIGLIRACGINYEFYTRLNKNVGFKEVEILYKMLLPCRLYVLDVDELKDKIGLFLEFVKGKDNVVLRF